MSRLEVVNSEFSAPSGMQETTFLPMAKKKPTQPPQMGPGWKILHQALASLVKESGMSIGSIAVKADVSRQYLHDIMIGQANPTFYQLEKLFEAAGTPLDRWLEDRALYGRDKNFHDKVQNILNAKGSRAVALKVIVDDAS